MNLGGLGKKIKTRVNRIIHGTNLSSMDYCLINIRKQVNVFTNKKKSLYGPKILYGPSFGLFEPTQVHDFFISQALILRGANIFPLSVGTLFSKILNRPSDVRSVLEIGTNIGLNLQAIRILVTGVKLAAIEINEPASQKLSQLGEIDAYNQLILYFSCNKKYDFVLSNGVLLHIILNIANSVELFMKFDF